MRLLNNYEFGIEIYRFNTASGMRSHATMNFHYPYSSFDLFQYRKRYEVTCDSFLAVHISSIIWFQYRKRYEVTCDTMMNNQYVREFVVSIPQAV